MATYVFVHGGNVSATTWNQLARQEDFPANTQLGGQVWDTISQPLQQKGHAVYTPSLGNEYKHNLSDHIEQICQLITSQKLNNVILVGHSYGGMVITGIADKVPNRINQLVYIDAAIPEDGQSLHDLLHLGGIIPKSVIENEESAIAYTEKIRLHNTASRNKINKDYIFCTQSEFKGLTHLVHKKIALQENWKTHEVNTGHLLMATKPQWLIDFLLKPR